MTRCMPGGVDPTPSRDMGNTAVRGQTLKPTTDVDGSARKEWCQQGHHASAHCWIRW